MVVAMVTQARTSAGRVACNQGIHRKIFRVPNHVVGAWYNAHPVHRPRPATSDQRPGPATSDQRACQCVLRGARSERSSNVRSVRIMLHSQVGGAREHSQVGGPSKHTQPGGWVDRACTFTYHQNPNPSNTV